MKKLITALCAALIGSAQAAPFDLYMNQMSADGTGYQNRQLTVPNGGAGVDGMLIYSGANSLPMIATFASGCSITFGVFNCTGASQVNADWNSVSGVSQILNKPTAVSAFTNDAGYLTGITSGQVTSALGFTPYNATNPSGYRTQAQVRSDISLTTTGSGAATYNSGTGVLNVPTPATPAAPSQSGVSRSLNTAYQVSATRNSLVFYSVQCTVTASIAGGQNCDVILEIASDSGFTTNVQTVSINGVGQTYTLAIALQGIQPQTSVLSGFVPAGYYARLRTVQNTGSPTFLYRAGQEVLL